MQLASYVVERLLERNTLRSINNIQSSLKRLHRIAKGARIMAFTDPSKEEDDGEPCDFLRPGVPVAFVEALEGSRENSIKTMVAHMLQTLRCYGFDEAHVGFRTYCQYYTRLGRSYYAPTRKDEEYAEQLPGRWADVIAAYEVAKANELKTPLDLQVARALVVMALVVMLPARQNEYVTTRVRRFPLIKDKREAELEAVMWVESNPAESANVLCLTNHLWVRSQHKTVSKYGTVVSPVPTELVAILDRFQRTFNTDLMLPTLTDTTKSIGTCAFYKLLNLQLGTSNIGTQMVRKLRISHEIDNDATGEERAALATQNGHSLQMQSAVYGRLSRKLHPSVIKKGPVSSSTSGSPVSSSYNVLDEPPIEFSAEQLSASSRVQGSNSVQPVSVPGHPVPGTIQEATGVCGVDNKAT